MEMTLDEALHDIEQYLKMSSCTSTSKQVQLYGSIDSIKTVYETLCWYMNHDLIRRKDAIREGTIALRDLMNIDAISAKNEIEYRMNQIPKEEPPKE